MAKIKEDIAQRIKDAANILDVMEDLGVSLKKSGVEYTGLCPFHKGTKFGNFKVNSRKNIATCFGDCCKSWTPIDALMEGANMTYPESHCAPSSSPPSRPLSPQDFPAPSDRKSVV